MGGVLGRIGAVYTQLAWWCICTPQRWFQAGFVASPTAEMSNNHTKMALSRADDASVIILFFFFVRPPPIKEAWV